VTGQGHGGLTVIGCGYTGRRLADQARGSGLPVTGLVRSPGTAAELDSLGIPSALLDLDATPVFLEPGLIEGRAVVYMVPPPPAGVEDRRAGAFLAALTARPRTVVYLSTSGVYGDCKGTRVTEESPARPRTDRAKRRLAAERVFRAWCAKADVPLRILRVPGIYGPGRLPLDRIRKGVPIPEPGATGPGNRIHVDDLAAACLAAARYSGAAQIFNVGDGDSRDMNAWFRAVADAAALPRPPELPMQTLLENISPAFASFLTESRELDVTRMHRELGVTPRYPDFERGIHASLAAP
jgi:nucleoside-diphosphate-sugar epimerase